MKLDNQRSDVVAGQGDPEQRGTFLVRARSEYKSPSISNKRIVWNGEAYEIESARPMDRQRRYYEVSTVYRGEVA